MSNIIAEKFNYPASIYWSSGSDFEYERMQYYYGLPSKPISVFRIGPPFQRPTGFEAYRVPKTIRPVFDDKLAAVWEDTGTCIYNYLDSIAVKWTTIDVVRFAEPLRYLNFEESVGPVVLWIGVIPKSLSHELAQEAAHTCKNILMSFDIDGVEIAFRESHFRRYSCTLLDYIPSDNPIAFLCSPLTASLGLPIASVQTPGSVGTGGIYLSAGHDIFLLTARHVVLPHEEPSIVYNHKESSQDAIQVMLPTPDVFDDMVKSIWDKIDSLKTLKEFEKRVMTEYSLKKNELVVKTLEDFQRNIIKDWAQWKNFIIGRVLYAPPISANEGSKRNMEDWALIELDRSKINWSNFRGNVVDLGMTEDEFGVVPEDELTRPRNQDKTGQPYIKLIKNGGGTKTSVGFGNGIKSFVREYFSDGTEQTSLEFAILAQEKHSVFSNQGDSGAVIVDSEGRAAALLIGGCGYEESTDITYATSFEWLLERIKAKFPNVHLYQTEYGC
ncbi:hypothetical protein BDQ17DRAFT_1429957 [Cyathus striatus]|nr:hypothetical protein BDQ17DRAFT_1429957 [Cyathus striatus]